MLDAIDLISHGVQLPEGVEVKKKWTNKHGCGTKDKMSKEWSFPNKEVSIAVTGKT